MFAKIWPKFSMSVVEGAIAAASRELDNVEAKLFRSRDFRLKNGQVLPELKIAYETYGKLAPDGRNAVLITHGYTASPHVAGRYKASDAAPGNWDALIGPGKAIDTDRYFVVSSNNLGSSYGSSSPRDINPATGKPYGPDFPHHVTLDTIAAQKLLLEHLGVKHLVAVVGWSYGGGLAFLWGVTYPDFVDAIVPTVSAPVVQYQPSVIDELTARLATDPNWNGGRYYENGGIERVLTEIRIETVKRYGIEAELAAQFPEKEAREAEIRRRARSLGENLRWQLAHRAAARHARLQRREGFLEAPRESALRAVHDRRRVSDEACARRHEQAQSRRGRRRILRARQPLRPHGAGARRPKMGADAQTLPEPRQRRHVVPSHRR